MFQVINPALGSPQITVQQTQADWAKFLGRDGGTVPLMRPGYKVEAYDGIFGQATFMLAYGVASNVIGAAVRIGAGYATTLAAASVRGQMAISMSANTDTAALSWYCIQGQCPVKASTMAVNLPLFSSGTAGSLSSSVSATNEVTGASSVLAASGTVTTKSIRTVNTTDLIEVPDLDGLYVGQSVTGTGVGASAVISAIGQGGTMLGAMGPSKNFIQVSVVSTASGRVTGTFAHPATFGTASLAYPVMAGLG